MPRPQRRNSDHLDEWIAKARARLAARKDDRPATKSGAIRAPWPEIQQTLQNGQTLKTVRDWLEAEGVSVRYNQLTTYVSRLRKKMAHVLETPAMKFEISPAPIVRDPLANLRSRDSRSQTFNYSPEFKKEDLL